jgi:hypothetical protein
MSDLSLTKTKIQSGVWQGVVTGGESQPKISVMHLGQPIEGVSLSQGRDESTWLLQIPIPADAIADGVQTLLITDAETDDLLDRITLIAGEELDEDLRAEVDLLRAELDMLKRAFRRHCLETA